MFVFVRAEDLAVDFLECLTAQVEFASYRSRLHRQMLALLPRFCFSDKFSKQLRNLATSSASAVTKDGRDLASDISLAYQEIASNLTSFCRAVITHSSMSQFFFFCFVITRNKGLLLYYREVRLV
jgi:hypothetical protein